MKSTAFAIAAMTTFSALAAQKIQMPLTCTNPDGLAVAPSGRLVIAAPNNARTQPGSIFYIDKPGAAPCKWFSVPLHPDTGCAAPMGICFGPDGALYVCDNQRDSKGRLLRITFKGEAVATCETVACGLENANGVKFLDGRLYMTQAFLRKIKRDDGALSSGLYMFNASDRNVRVTNTAADPQLVFTDYTANPKMRVGLNGVAVDSKGFIYTGNYGDGRIWKLKPGADGRIVSKELFVKSGVVTPDGLCVDPDDNLYTADMHGDAAVKINGKGEVSIVAKGCFTRPSEPCWWQGSLYVSDYAATTLTKIPLP